MNILKKFIIFFPFILLFPAVLHGICWFTCSDWGPLASLVWLILSAVIVWVIELISIIIYIMKFWFPDTVRSLFLWEGHAVRMRSFVNKIILFMFLGILLWVLFAIGSVFFDWSVICTWNDLINFLTSKKCPDWVFS